MKVVLLISMSGLGEAGEVVDVKQGYAVNYLFPNGYASADLTVKVSKKEAGISKEMLPEILKKLNKSTFTVTKKANEKGVLFSALSADDIVKQIISRFSIISEEDLQVKVDSPLKAVGEYSVKGTLKDKGFMVQVNITPMEVQGEENSSKESVDVSASKESSSEDKSSK